MIRYLLQIPLSVKLLVANGVLIAAAAATGVAFGRADPAVDGAFALVLLLAILLVMIGVNSLLVKIALGPVRRMGEAAERVSRGNLDTLVPPSPVADRSLGRLIDTFNDMVSSVRRTREVRDRLVRDLLAAGERDRKVLADELLAGPSQSLSTTLLLLRRHRSEGDESAGLAAESVREALEELRRISAALHPPELDELGLAPALRVLVRSRLESRGIPCRVEVKGRGGDLPRELRLAVFRLVQEGVEIPAAFPDLTSASLALRRNEDALVILLAFRAHGAEDGMEHAPGARPRGLAGTLRRMEERARLLGGTLDVRAAPEGETELRIRIPIQEAKPAGEERSPPSFAGTAG